MINCCLSLPSFASSFPVGLHSCRYGLVSRSPLLNLIHLPSIPPSILPDTSQQAKTTFLVGCSLFIFLCLLLAFLSFPSRFFTPIINSVVLSCALFHWSPSSFCSTCSLADCLFCPDALRMSCTPSVFFPFSLPKSPSTPSLYQKHKLQNSVLLRLPRHDGPLATYFCNTCGTNTAATRAKLIKLQKIFELVMPCDWYLPAIKVENYSFSRGPSEVRCTQPKGFNSKSPRGVALLSEENWQAVHRNVTFCEWKKVRLYSKEAAGEMQQVGARAAQFNASEIPDSAE